MSMDDRTLLEKAAKAAGIDLMWSRLSDISPRSVETGNSWNPLTDDGDALRLAVKLEMMIDFVKKGYMYGCVVAVSNGGSCYEQGFSNNATRRAITRAAASIGETPV